MKKDSQFTDLSRRKLLAGLGAIGVTSAGAGFGTSAYFNDTESFTGNRLTAGEFDLKVDWQQEYYGPTETWEPVNAYPDVDEDDVQDLLQPRTQIALDEYGTTDLGSLQPEDRQAVEEAFRAQFADLPTDFEMPVIDLEDVKPGDKGEITISLHLFDNPGLIWFGGSLEENAENGQTEPEAIVDETDGDPGDGAGELADAIQAKVWYDDDCDNRHDLGEPPCIQFVIDDSDSMGTSSGVGTPPKNEAIVDALTDYFDELEDFDTADDGDMSPTSAGVTLFPNGTIQNPTPDKADAMDALDALLDQDTSGTIDLIDGIEDGAAALETCPEGSQRVMVVISNGINVDNTAAYNAAQTAVMNGQVDQFVTIAAVPQDINAITTFQDIAALTADGVYLQADETTDIYDRINGTTGPSVRTVVGVGAGIGNETIIAEGSLREVLTNLPTDSTPGIGGDSGVLLDADRTTEAIDCFPNSTTRCLAMLWELPTDVGNEVQTDRVVFDLDLYAEQCRHNATPEERTPFAPE